VALFRGFSAAKYRYTLMITFGEVAEAKFETFLEQTKKREEIYLHNVFLDEMQATRQ
jgi:hypothetical protein